ncbi:3-phenylpropionate/cinnamic acid dioxygenase subunit beta [Rugosimonospora acidiphila]|uniref:3-phenylpropionate/cinnamic acid dioxygenase subunit beta n=1 Tax=Rugosimonospora acidiphila TaxID=556531 RepID=A0ABP9S327_9ACTN
MDSQLHGIEAADAARYGEHAAIRDFYSLEARLLDDNLLTDWLGLLHENVAYLVPNRTFKPLVEDDFSVASGVMVDDHDSVAAKVARYETLHAWSEDPPSMTRRFVTNVEIGVDPVSETPPGRAWTARTNVLVYHARRDQQPALISAGRRDVLVDGGNGLRVWRRLVHLDHNTLPVQDLAIFL